MAGRPIDSPQELAVAIAKELDGENAEAVIRVGLLRERLRAIATEANEKERPLSERDLAVALDADGRWLGTPLVERD
jgi:hypothetical protein